MSWLLLADPGTRWTEAAEPWALAPSYYSLDNEMLVEKVILILEIPNELWGREIFAENFLIQVLAGGRSRTAEVRFAGPSSYPLDHQVFVEWIISELPDESWGREILQYYEAENRKYYKSKSLNLTLNCDVKNRVSFFRQHFCWPQQYYEAEES